MTELHLSCPLFRFCTIPVYYMIENIYSFITTERSTYIIFIWCIYVNQAGNKKIYD